MAGKVLNLKVCNPLKLRSGLTGKYHAICHYSYNLPLQIKYEFIIDEVKPAAGGKCILYVDGQKVAEGHIPKTQPYAYSGDEGVDVGTDNETNVTNDYKEGDNKFTGED